MRQAVGASIARRGVAARLPAVESTLAFVGAGLAQGMAAGLTPGPLLALLLARAVRDGAQAALLVAMAPLITDAPIVLAAVLLVGVLPSQVLDGLAIVGGGYVARLGWHTVADARSAALEDAERTERASGARTSALRAGVLTNALSPHPYLFWALVGVPALASANASGGAPPSVGLLVGFYAGIVGTKAMVGVATARGTRLLGGSAHRLVLGACGAALVGLGVLLLLQGARGLLA